MALQHLSDDVIVISDGDFTIGDRELMDLQIGGDDTFEGAEGGSYRGSGDAIQMTNVARGGDDIMVAGSYTGNGDPYSFNTGVTYFGDAVLMSGRAAGGDDALIGGVDSSIRFIGDASDGAELVKGGRDTLVGANAGSQSDGAPRGIVPLGLPLPGPIPICDADHMSSNMLIGDFYTMGGEDIQRSQPTREEPQLPDAVRGGNDEIHGGHAFGFGDSAEAFNVMMGDAYAMGGAAHSGDDRITAGNAVSSDGLALDYNFAAGDAFFMSDGAVGGRDRLTGGSAFARTSDSQAFELNVLVGDGMVMGQDTRANNDQLTGGSAHGAQHGSFGDAYALNLLAGDSFDINGPFRGDGPGHFGNDTLTGGNGDGSGYAINLLWGDVGSSDGLFIPPGPPGILPKVADPADWKTDLGNLEAVIFKGGIEHAHFGKDVITGGAGNAFNLMIGDATNIGSDSHGGNDTLVGGGEGSINAMYGDALFIGEDGFGGNDRLVSGQGDDNMWGDGEDNLGHGGADRFVFTPHNGDDTIYDFHTSERDKIDLSAFRDGGDFNSVLSMMAAGRIEQSDGAVILHLDLNDAASDHNTVTIVGVSVEQLMHGAIVFR